MGVANPSREREKGAAGVMGGPGESSPRSGVRRGGAPRQPQCITLGRLAPRHYALRRRPRCPRLARRTAWEGHRVLPRSGPINRPVRPSTPAGQVADPVIHEPAATLEQVRAPVGRLDLAADPVRQGSLRHLARMIRFFGRPVMKARPEAVRHHRDLQLPEQFRQRRGRERLAPRLGNTSGLLRPIARASSRISRARRHSGTQCSRFPFVRGAGMLQTPSSRSISVQTVPLTSPERATGGTRNSKASFTAGFALDARTALMAAAISRCGKAQMKTWTQVVLLNLALITAGLRA